MNQQEVDMTSRGQIPVLVFLGLICGCADSNPVRPTPISPTRQDVVMPSISSISPTSTIAGSPGFTLTVTGTNFLQHSGSVGSWVTWSGALLDTTFVSTTELTAVVPAALLYRWGPFNVFVENGDSMAISEGYRRNPRSNVVVFNVSVQPTATVLGVYRATLTASSACASALPLAARERTYTATLLSDGRIEWTGPTLTPPSGHSPISSGIRSGDVFSFSIDVERRDPQDDGFNGIWDDMDGPGYLNISGNGSGTVDDGEITGLLTGTFAFHELVQGRNIGHYCSAVDHRFRLVKEQ
jgi:hypothetical protein